MRFWFRIILVMMSYISSIDVPFRRSTCIRRRIRSSGSFMLMMTVYHDWMALPVMGIADRVPSGRDVPDRDPMEVVLALLPPETGS